MQTAVARQPGQAGGASGDKRWQWLRLPLPLGSGSGRLGVFLLDLAEQETLEVSIRLIHLLNLHQHRSLHIRQADGDGLHWTASSRSSFSAIASRQKAEIFRQRLFFSRSSAWWSCCGCGGGSLAGGLLLGIRLRFHKYAPQQLAIGLAFHQQAADELGCDDLGGAGEEGWMEVLGERGGCGNTGSR